MEKSILRILLGALLAAYLVTALLLLGLAFGLYRLQLDESQINLGVSAVYIAACLIGGIVAGKRARSRRFLWGLACGSVYFLILLGLTYAFQNGFHSDAREIALSFLMCAGAGTLGGMIS